MTRPNEKYYGGDACMRLAESLGAGYGGCVLNMLKYPWRAGKKDPAKVVEDLEKADWYLQRGIDFGWLTSEEPAKEKAQLAVLQKMREQHPEDAVVLDEMIADLQSSRWQHRTASTQAVYEFEQLIINAAREHTLNEQVQRVCRMLHEKAFTWRSGS